MRIAWLSALVVTTASTVGCGGKVVFDGAGGGLDGAANGAADGSGGASSSGSSGIDLEPICKKFCDAYEVCAPQTQCKIGCMSSADLACKKEYAADVECITAHLSGCTGFSAPCAAAQKAYEQCVAQH